MLRSHGAHPFVEDELLISEFTVEMLREESYDVIQANNGDEALAWCKQKVEDVLVTDIKLPGTVDGWQIGEHCRGPGPSLPVIYATGFSPAGPVQCQGVCRYRSLIIRKRSCRP